MNIENFKKQLSKEQEVELTEEQIDQVKKFYIDKGAKDFKTCISDIAKYISNKNITIDQAIKEVNDKNSGLSLSRRNLLLAINPDIWKQWIKPKEKIKKFDYASD